MGERRRPGGQMATRPLHFIWITDCSGSMRVDGKIQALNNAIRESIPHMKSAAEDNPNVEVLVRAIKFSTGAKWHIKEPTKLEDFVWEDLTASGVTELGKALTMVADELKIPPMTNRAYPPVLVLITDGQPTDNYELGLEALMAQKWGEKAVKIAIGINSGSDLDGDLDKKVLERFIANPEIEPLQTNSVELLLKYIKWVSSDVLQLATATINHSQGEIENENAQEATISLFDIMNSDEIW